MFEVLAAAPRSADVLAIAFIAAFAATALVFETETGELALLDQLERTGSLLGESVDDEVRYATLQEISKHGTFYALVTSLVSGPLLAIGVSAALFAWGQIPGQIPGLAPSYRQVLAITSHAGVILALRQLLMAPLIYARETVASPLTLSMFFTLLDEGSSLARFAGMIDVFVIWWIVVLAIGVSVLYRRRTAGVAAAFAGVYLALAALVALIVAMTGRVA